MLHKWEEINEDLNSTNLSIYDQEPVRISREELLYAGGCWSFISLGWFCLQARSNYPSRLSSACREIYGSATTVLWQLASCPAVYLLPPHSSHY